MKGLRGLIRDLHHGAAVSVVAIMVSTAAGAQTPATAPAASTDAPVDNAAPAPAAAGQADTADREIVVTGSRITGGFTSPTPVTVLTSERASSLAINNVGEALNQLPSFRATSSPATQANIGGNIGARLLDLRGLNPQRTLVLVDGKRFVPSTSQGSVDVNLIPSSLVQRTEVVTGGASAAYGSDAVAGVVNFVLDRKFTGFKGEVNGGISQRGDDSSQFASATAGFKVGDRIHVIIAGEYENNSGLADCNSRSWCARQTLILGNSPAGAGGLPANLIVANVNTSTVAPGGLINRSYNAAGQTIGTTATDPLRGLTFNPDGSTRRFQYGTLVGPLFMLGGEGNGTNAFLEPLLLKAPVRRYSAYSAITADVTDDITATLDLSYGRVRGRVVSNVLRDYNASLMGRIQQGNPFIPASVAATMSANNVASFILGRAGFDLGPSSAVSTTSTYRAVAGLKGKIGSSSWTWDLSYEYGKTQLRQKTHDALNVLNLPKAVDAVRNGAGQIVCRINADAVATNDDPACAPINLFGEGRFSAAARAYVLGNGFQSTDNDQHDVALNVQGGLIDLPAGPLTLAVGAEYRRDKISGTADPVSLQNGFFTLNGSALSGHVGVKEAYGELAVPILKDSPIGRSLELNGAVRRTDYSTSGAVTTWKAGGVYEPIDAIRLRLTKSRDIRAPNLAELVGPRVKSTIGLTDPLNGLQTNPVVFTGSNANLSPEKADSLTVGGVLAPTGGFLRRARLSVDYYDIKVKNAIGTLGAQTLANRCAQGVTEYCALITRDASNTITTVFDLYLNSAAVRTRGFDIEFQYRQPLGRFGALSTQILANVVRELTTVDSAGSVDRAGQTGLRTGTIPGVPDYTLDGIVTWSLGSVQVTGHGHYVPSGYYWTNFTDPTQSGYSITSATSVNDNRIPSRFTMDLTTQYTIASDHGRKIELFAAVKNLFDRDPPAMPGPTGGTNQILFDPVGREFKVGARVYFGG